MGKLNIVKLVIALFPCLVKVFQDISKAKEDDGEVDTAEIIEIVGNFGKCVAQKMGWDV